tara:strand:- start:2429 stop:3211 length:783 start_codon:yes stop_codon:yes gene_type:complete
MSLKSTVTKNVPVNIQALRGQKAGTTTSYRNVDGIAVSALAAGSTGRAKAQAGFRVGGGGALIDQAITAGNNLVGTASPITTVDTTMATSDGALAVTGRYEVLATSTITSKWSTATRTTASVAPDNNSLHNVAMSLVVNGPASGTAAEDRQVIKLEPQNPVVPNGLNPQRQYIKIISIPCATTSTSPDTDAANTSITAGERCEAQPVAHLGSANGTDPLDATTTPPTITIERTVPGAASGQVPFSRYVLQVVDLPPTYTL